MLSLGQLLGVTVVKLLMVAIGVDAEAGAKLLSDLGCVIKWLLGSKFRFLGLRFPGWRFLSWRFHERDESLRRLDDERRWWLAHFGLFPVQEARLAGQKADYLVFLAVSQVRLASHRLESFDQGRA